MVVSRLGYLECGISKFKYREYGLFVVGNKGEVSNIRERKREVIEENDFSNKYIWYSLSYIPCPTQTADWAGITYGDLVIYLVLTYVTFSTICPIFRAQTTKISWLGKVVGACIIPGSGLLSFATGLRAGGPGWPTSPTTIHSWKGRSKKKQKKHKISRLLRYTKYVRWLKRTLCKWTLLLYSLHYDLLGLWLRMKK